MVVTKIQFEDDTGTAEYESNVRHELWFLNNFCIWNRGYSEVYCGLENLEQPIYVKPRS